MADSESIPNRLVDRFFAILLGLEPSSVLDVGCGTGRILERCRGAGIECRGLEPNGERVEALSSAGFDVSVGRAEELPLDNNSFDWVVLRHVAHHLVDERPALAEAFRVCRSGLLVAEPCLDLAIGSQRVARRFDDWLDQQNTRAGHVHRSALTAADFLAAVPDSVRVDAVVDRLLILQPRPEGWLANEATPFLDDLDGAARREFSEIEADAQTIGLSHNGSMIVTLSIV